VSCVGLKKSVPETARITCGAVASAIAARRVCRRDSRAIRVVRGRARVTTQPRILSVVEYVEGFGAELEVFAFGHGDVLQQGHVKVRAPRIPQIVSSRIAESKTRGSDERGGVIDQSRVPWREWWYPSTRIAHDIGVGSGRR